MVNLAHWVTAFALFSLVILSGALFIGDVNENYPEANLSSDEFGDVYNTINDTFDLSQDMKGTVFDSDIDETDVGDSMLGGSFTAIRLVKNTFGMMGNILSAVQQRLGIPQFVVQFAIIIFTTLVIFAIIFLVMRFEPRA